ncbi:MAG: M24 family metallopeptidase [Pseudomonadota bacterium]
MDNQQQIVRRDIMKYGALGLIAAGFTGRVDKVAAMQALPSQAGEKSLTAQLRATGGDSQKLLLAPLTGVNSPPPPATYDMLPRAWNKAAFKKLHDRVAERGCKSVLLRNANNCSYFTGYWFSNTERPQAILMNAGDEAPWYYHPVIDTQLIKSGWYGGGRAYFDFPHATGAFPNEGKVSTGATVDMLEFMLEGMKEKGIEGGKLAIDGELYPSEQAKFAKILPGVEIVNVSDIVRQIRWISTPEELALSHRAYQLNDRAHAFARDYVLAHGTDVTDLEIQLATQLWLLDTLRSGLKLDGGLPNRGVASGGVVMVRCGRTTAYPHPNQPYYQRLGRDMPLQVVIVAKVGGCGGENYRMYQTANASGGFDAHGTKMWEVSQHTCDMQRDLQAAGRRCSEVAAAIHKYQVDQGMADYIYHRPGHGQQSEGHYAPYIALGDHTVLQKNMLFSQEPGLYDPEKGVGYNWSDTIVTGEGAGYRMSRVPYDKQWSFIRI